MDTIPPALSNGSSTPRNIVICFDGTNNQFGKVNTNVIRLVQVANRDQLKQRLYYDPGVGTLPEPGRWTWLSQKLSDLWGLAFGAGLVWKVGEAYAYLMDIWEPGDQVFIFGFSRGAYSARVLAGMLHAFGLLPLGSQNMVPYMSRLFKGARQERKDLDGKSGPWQELCDSFRWTFARQVTSGDDQRHFPVHFVGVWDTVSSVGGIWTPDRFPFTANNPSVRIARHAISIDERRAFFLQNLFTKAPGQNLKEHWFAGAHCDVGGGYPEDEIDDSETVYAGTWRSAFLWMIEEAKAHGFLVDDDRMDQVLRRAPSCTSPWEEKIHDSLWCLWPPWPLGELIPKWVWNSAAKKSQLQLGLGRHRTILPGALISKATLQRIRATSYAPPNLSSDFIARVKALPTVPDDLAY
jgi:uncharacterized protein (DUF2235 family)